MKKLLCTSLAICFLLGSKMVIADSTIKDDDDRECLRIGFKQNTQEFTACKYRLTMDRNAQEQRINELKVREATLLKLQQQQERRANEALMIRGLEMMQGR